MSFLLYSPLSLPLSLFLSHVETSFFSSLLSPLHLYYLASFSFPTHQHLREEENVSINPFFSPFIPPFHYLHNSSKLPLPLPFPLQKDLKKKMHESPKRAIFHQGVWLGYSKKKARFQKRIEKEKSRRQERVRR